MVRFLRSRGFSLAVVVLVMFIVAMSQAGISYSVELGPLRRFQSTNLRVVEAGLYALRIAFLLLLAMLWLLNHKRALFRAIIAANTYFTVALLADVMSLMVLLGDLRKAAPTLLIDAALTSVA